MPLVDNEDLSANDRAWENMAHIRLYDPPKDGKTPLDGSGNPSSSIVVLRDKAAKLKAGFTTDVVGLDGEYPTLGDTPVRAGTQASIEKTEPVSIPVERATIKRSSNRTRTIKK